MTEKTCPVCGKSFPLPPTRKKQIYCSRDCSVIGRKTTKESSALKRVESFIERLPEITIVDVLDGRLGSGTDNRMVVTGARMWEDGSKFIVLVVKD